MTFSLLRYHIKEAWYRFKCWAWRRHTTIKPRTLDHGWCDRGYLIVHLMMEVNCQFVEQEILKTHVEWYGETSPKATDPVTGESRFVADILKDIRRWWLEEYLVRQDKHFDKLHDYRKDHCKTEEVASDHYGEEVFEWVTTWDSEESEKEAECIYKECSAAEEADEAELEARLVSLIKLRGWMWT